MNIWNLAAIGGNTIGTLTIALCSDGMVTLQAKRQQQQQQQQQQASRRQRSYEQQAVADDAGWNDHRTFDRESAAIGERYETRTIDDDDDDWTVGEIPVAKSEINDKRPCRTENGTVEKSSSGLTCHHIVNGDVNGSNDGSTQCSDFDEDEDEEKDLGLAEEEKEEHNDDDDDDDERDDSESERSDRWIRRKVVTTRVQHDANSNGDEGQAVVLPNLDDTTFGQVCITNSSNVHVGNTNFYKGPVTIKQFVYTNAYPVQDKDDGSLEANCSGRISDINPNDVPVVKGDPNGPILASYRDYDTVTKWLWTWRCAAILCVLALILVTIVAVVSVLLSRNNDDSSKKTIQESPTSGASENDTLVNGVRFIERDMWGAQPPTEPPEKLAEVPVPYVIISHTATQPCVAQSECVLRVRVAQTLHIESFKWDDIGYNFLIGGDGNAYVGRGWDAKGSHAFGWNQKSMGISFIGTFNDVAPSAKQLHAAEKAIEFGVQIGKISPTYKVLGHRQVSETLSPGDELYKILQTWDHWSPTPRPSTPTQGAVTNGPHPAVALPLALLILPQLILLLRRLSNFLLKALLEFGNRRFFHSFVVCGTIV